MDVISILRERRDRIAADEDRESERETIKGTLKVCGSPCWPIRAVKEKMDKKEDSVRKSKKKKYG